MPTRVDGDLVQAAQSSGAPNSASAAELLGQYERIADRIAHLDLAKEFRATGEAWSEIDADGNIVTVQP